MYLARPGTLLPDKIVMRPALPHQDPADSNSGNAAVRDRRANGVDMRRLTFQWL